MIAASPYVETSLQYFGAEGSDDVPAVIYDARTANGLNWQTNGFELLRHDSSVGDWENPAELSGVYTNEIEAQAIDATGCDAVLFYPPVLRNPESRRQHPDFSPIPAAHSDYTESYGDMIRDGSHPYRQAIRASQERAGLADTEIAACRRILTLQFWRNTGSQFPDFPLALCDCRSVRREHMTPVMVAAYGGLRTEFESLLLMAGEHTRDHQWFTYPGMTTGEMVMFRAYDSDLVASRQPFWTPHCAFADPAAGRHAPARESVEMRAICLFL